MTGEQGPLAALVSRTHDAGVSYREMESRATQRGHRISHSQMADYAGDRVAKCPTEEQLRSIAAALDVGYETVRAAAFAQFYGYVPRELGGRQTPVVAAIPPDLTPEEERQLTAMVRAWAAARESDSTV